jgi:hypothetical protein
MTKSVFVSMAIFALVIAGVSAQAGERGPKPAGALSDAASRPHPTDDDCEARMQKLDASNAEGEERLAEKNEVIDFCDRQYEHDTTIKRLVTECMKYEEQPVVKQQFVAECQLAAFNYANALRDLKMDYGK